MEVETLLRKKSKPEVAAAVRAACNQVTNSTEYEGENSSPPEIFERVVEQILTNPKSLSDVDDEETLDWCQWLIAGGTTPEEFSETVRSYDKATTCGLVWTENFVAYRCRTCGISPYLSLCTDCFHRGNHEGHDFIVFRSETGGACDCGEINVIKESGCCVLHGPRGTAAMQHNQYLGRNSEPSSAPPELFRIANGMMPRLFHRLIAYLRAVEARKLRTQQLLNSKNTTLKTKKTSHQKSSPPPSASLAATAAAMIHSNPGGVVSPPPRGHKFIKLLQTFSDMGMTMRQVMTTALTSSPVYTSLCGEGSLSPEYRRLGLKIPENSQTFLEELVYWTVKREFPEDLVCLLLSLRSDSSYNECFARAFITHYELISQTILRSSDPERLCKHIAAVSVQLFSKEKLAIAMVEQMQLLHLLLRSLHDMIRSTAVPISSVPALSSLESPAEPTIEDVDEDDGFEMVEEKRVEKHCNRNDQSILKVIDCDNDIIKNNYYWLFKSDLKEILSHGPVAIRFFSDPQLLSTWFEFLTLMQGMNVNKFVRKGEPHVEHESDSYVGAFMAELVISATLMCTLVGHLKDSRSSEITQNFIRLCMNQLKRWHGQVKYPKGTISFHLPLHRYLSTFIRQGMQWQGIPLEKILPPEEEFKEVVVRQLLRLQTAYYGISTRLWARNGPSLVNQAEYYVSSLCCNSMVDADLFLLQVEAVRKPIEFLEMLLEEFGVEDALSIQSLRKGSEGDNKEENMDWMEEPEEQLTMLENFMIFMATLVSVRTNLGMSDQELMALEMSVLLCKSDRLHSELMEMLPERCSSGSGNGGGSTAAGAAAGTSNDVHQKNFDEILGKIADFQAPRNMQQGIFTPKPVVWEEIYDPVYTLLRSSSRAEYQSSRDRYQDWVNREERNRSKKLGDNKNGDGSSVLKNLWPPFRLPPKEDSNRFMESPADILRNKRFIEVAFVVLYHGVHTGLLGELTIGLCVHMIELLVHLVTSSKDGEIVLEGFIAKIQVPGKNEGGGVCDRNHSESIVSLLMQLYTKLSESGRHYTLKSDEQEEEMPSELSTEVRIGDGPFFIGKVLDKVAEKWEEARQYINEEIKKQSDDQGHGSAGALEMSLEEKEREEKRRKAKERKLHLMNEYAMKRQQFMTGSGHSTGQSIDEDEDGGASSPTSQQQGPSDLLQLYQDHECVICMEKLETKPNNPFGLMTYLSPCNILGYQRLHMPEGNGPFLKEIHKETLEEYLRHYDDSSVIQHIPLDPGFGVQVQSCGHLIHQDCFTSYMAYVKKAPASSSQVPASAPGSNPNAKKSVIPFTYKEYTCPLCRQLGNSFLPIIPTSLIKIPSASASPPGNFSEISKMIKKRNKCSLSNAEQRAVSCFIQDINACAWNNFEWDLTKMLKDFDAASPLVSAFLLTSHLRQAVERQLKLRESSSSNSATPSSSSSSAMSKKLSSLLPMLSVIKYQYKTLPVGYARKLAQNWEMVCGKRASKGNGELPTLLRDVETALYHFVLDLPLMSTPSESNEGIFDGVVQALYNLRVIQVLTAVCSQFSEVERREIKKAYGESTNALDMIMGEILKNFEKFFVAVGDEELTIKTAAVSEKVVTSQQDENGNHNVKNVEVPDSAFVENLLESMLLPYLKTAAHLKSELYGQECITQDFAALVKFLELGSKRISHAVEVIREEMNGNEKKADAYNASCSSVDYIFWGDGDSALECESVIANWCLELIGSLNNQNKQQRSIDTNVSGIQKAAELLKSHLYLYDRPSLIRLPREYDTIFENYRKVKCKKCDLVPSTPALCLICGEILCLNELCCFDLELEVSEVVSHCQKKCGRGTGLFLSVMTSEILIVREKEACIWGSIFLDSFCEEDLELKRGKPLFLCQERLDILQKNWIAQSFYKTELKWFQHENFL